VRRFPITIPFSRDAERSAFAVAFLETFVTSWPKQNGATLMELGVVTTSQVPSHGGSDGQYSREGSTAKIKGDRHLYYVLIFQFAKNNSQ
jgi:hypothetical protein